LYYNTYATLGLLQRGPMPIQLNTVRSLMLSTTGDDSLWSDPQNVVRVDTGTFNKYTHHEWRTRGFQHFRKSSPRFTTPHQNDDYL